MHAKILLIGGGGGGVIVNTSDCVATLRSLANLWKTIRRP